jgi:hypothetical protein
MPEIAPKINGSVSFVHFEVDLFAEIFTGNSLM